MHKLNERVFATVDILASAVLAVALSTCWRDSFVEVVEVWLVMSDDN
jgi:hypothetical protein